jgi:hypothetical protein
MEQSIGRASQPTTQADEPAADKHKTDNDVRRRVRDIPPPVHYDDTALTDPNAERRPADPLDPRLPSRETGDPLDPDGHVI